MKTNKSEYYFSLHNPSGDVIGLYPLIPEDISKVLIQFKKHYLQLADLYKKDLEEGGIANTATKRLKTRTAVERYETSARYCEKGIMELEVVTT